MWSYTWFCLVMVAQQVMCGVKIPIPKPGNTRIIGGEEAPAGKFTYQVFISYSRGEYYPITCGGSIISKDYIVTAGHCIDDQLINDPSTASVRIGSIFRNNGTKIKIDKVVRHPNYKRNSLDNDIAILKTTYEIEFNDNVKSIDLPPKGRIVEGEITVSGWGRVQLGEALIPMKLMYVNLPVMDFDKCEEIYGRLTENVWCAGDNKIGGPSACRGDSGGPAAQDDLLVGIVSWGEKCGVTGKPSVFANVASPSIRDFITEITGL